MAGVMHAVTFFIVVKCSVIDVVASVLRHITGLSTCRARFVAMGLPLGTASGSRLRDLW